jgi:glycosyltransferase involved in cell wall biosynthesis
MIVKNEEENLKKYFHKYDENIVVDTGSNDRTREVARELGADIYDFKWHDDYSAARNFGLSKATGDWILHLDADEMIDKSYFITLKKLTEVRNVDYYEFPTFTFIDEPADNSKPRVTYGQICRLFRNGIGIKYENIIHERLDNSLKKFKGEVAPFPIYHFGYLQKDRKKQKDEYYRVQNEKQLLINPNSHRHYFYLYGYWAMKKNRERALGYVKKAIEHCDNEMILRYIIDKRKIENEVFKESENINQYAQYVEKKRNPLSTQ